MAEAYRDRGVAFLGVNSNAQETAAQVRTLAEAGVPNLVFAVSYGIWAPSATPEPVIARLNAAFNEVLKDPDIKRRLAEASGAEIDFHESDVYAAPELLGREGVRYAIDDMSEVRLMVIRDV